MGDPSPRRDLRCPVLLPTEGAPSSADGDGWIPRPQDSVHHVCPALGLGVGLLQGDGRNKSELLLLGHYHLPQRTQQLGPTAGLSWEGKDALSTKRKRKDLPDTLLVDFQMADQSVGFGLPAGVKGVDTAPRALPGVQPRGVEQRGVDGHQSGHSPVHCWGLVTCMLVRGEGTAHLAVWTPGLEHIPVCDMDVQNQKLHLACPGHQRHNRA